MADSRGIEMRVSGKVVKEEGPRLREGQVQRHCCVKKNLQENESCLLRIVEDEAKEAGINYITDLGSG